MREGGQVCVCIIFTYICPFKFNKFACVVPYAQFVKDLKQFKVKGGPSWGELGDWALQCAKNSTKTKLHPEPLVVHMLDQKEGQLEFLAHHDNNKGTLCVCVCVYVY